MRLCVSSYERDNNISLSLLDVDINSKTYKSLFDARLTEPSFCISFKDYIVTYSKELLQLILYKVINNKLITMHRIELPISTLTHLYYDEVHKTIYGASYKDGSIIKVDIIHDELCNLKVINVGGLCHYITMDENHECVYEVNIKMDVIHKYDLNLNLQDTISLPKGIGPRHMNIKNNIIYFVTEYSNELYACNLITNEISSISTLSKDFKGKSNGATLLIDDKYIYASNRGEDSIAVIEYKNGLKYKYSYPCGGNHPRHMIFGPDNKIISFNKNSSNITILDKITGNIVMDIPYSKVSCGCIIEN